MEIQYDEIELAMGIDPAWGDGAYLDTTTGEVILMDDWGQMQAKKYERPEDIPAGEPEVLRAVWYLLYEKGRVGEEADEATEEAAEAYLDRLIPIPPFETHEEYEDMEDFARQVGNRAAAEQLQQALGGRGSFRRFKDTLTRFPAVREEWFAFQQAQRRRRIDEWLRYEGLLPETAEASPPAAAAEEAGAEPAGYLLNADTPLTEAEAAWLQEEAGGRMEVYALSLADGAGQEQVQAQVAALVAALGLAPAVWQTGRIWLVLPANSLAAALLLVEVHGRMGYYPEVVRRGEAGLEWVGLQAMWEAARERRY